MKTKTHEEKLYQHRLSIANGIKNAIFLFGGAGRLDKSLTKAALELFIGQSFKDDNDFLRTFKRMTAEEIVERSKHPDAVELNRYMCWENDEELTNRMLDSKLIEDRSHEEEDLKYSVNMITGYYSIEKSYMNM